MPCICTMFMECNCAARKMAILVPALDPKTGKPKLGKVKLLDEFKTTGQSTENLVALVNKAPGVCQYHPRQPALRRVAPFADSVRWTAHLPTVWDAAKNMYILDFRGRVTQASIRNFQAVRAENGALCCLQPDAAFRVFARTSHPPKLRRCLSRAFLESFEQRLMRCWRFANYACDANVHRGGDSDSVRKGWR